MRSIDRFISSYVSGSGCWLWAGNIDKDGYGRFGLDGKTQRAHRVAYQFFCGKIPKGMCVLHQCDVPACVNPDHLWLGTNSENTQDRCKKGRSGRSKGEKNGGSKLTELQVSEIRQRLKAGEKSQSIASIYGMSNTTVWRIGKGKRWAGKNTNTAMMAKLEQEA